MHREFVNSRRPDPRIYSAGDIVFARRAVRSDASRGVVDKLSFPFTGPWRIVRKLAGASYEIEHCKTKRVEKKHSSDLSPYPPEIIPFQPLDGADNQFGQLHKKISDHPYIQAGIDGFTPPQPFQVPLNFIDANGPDSLSFHWPTLAELNAELFRASTSRRTMNRPVHPSFIQVLHHRRLCHSLVLHLLPHLFRRQTHSHSALFQARTSYSLYPTTSALTIVANGD